MSSRLATREDLFDVMEQIAEERLAARPVVQQIITRGDEVWNEEIPESWRTAGFVQELTAAGAGILETDPTRSLSFTQLALAVASSIPRETYPSPVQPFIEGRAWREIGLAHRYLDVYDAALRAFDAAYRAFARESALIHEMARAQYRRAAVFLFRYEDDECVALLREAIGVFREFGDELSILYCEAARAISLWHRGDVKTALAITLELLAKYPETDDLHTLGVLHNNAGVFKTQLGNLPEAVSAFQRAREIFTVLEMPMEVDRVDWGLATILLSSGDFATALPLLYRLRSAYLARRMPEEAGLIALRIVDALVATESREEAIRLTEQVLSEFVTAKLNRHAITALAYLRDLLPTASKPRQAVNEVRSYVEGLRIQPARVFIPFEEKDEN